MIISYQLPRLGLVSTSIHKEAAQIYNFLLQEGEVERLKNLDHLGIVRRASEGAHHPRWETMMLMFRLIDLAKAHAHQAHLSTGVEISDSLEISSGTECLKAWTLLVNVGHLPLTFTAEKAFLHLLRCKRTQKWPEIKKEMVSMFPKNRPLKRFVKKTIEREMIYSFYQAIAAWRLQNWVKGGKVPGEWIDIMERLLVPENSPPKCKALYDCVEISDGLHT
jgi:HD superfamily phosphohydrolase